METILRCSNHGFSWCNFFTDTCIDDNVCIDRHTDTKDDTCDTWKCQCDVKCIQKDQDQFCVKDQCKAGCKSRKEVYPAHEYTYDCQTDDTCDQTSFQSVLSKLCSYNFWAKLFKFQIQSTDTDCRSDVISLFIIHVSWNLSFSILNHCIYAWHADQRTIIVNSDCVMVIVISFFCCCLELLCTLICQLKINTILFISCCWVVEYSGWSCLYFCTCQYDGVCIFQFVDWLIQCISGSCQGIVFISLTVFMLDKVQWTRLSKFFQNLVCVAHTRNLDTDTVVSNLISLCLCAVLLHTFLKLVHGVIHVCLRWLVTFYLICNADSAFQVKTEIDVLRSSHSL